MNQKIIVLVFVATYLPGCKGGGPIRSITNIVNALCDDFEFRIVTSDRDLFDKCQYVNIKVDCWCQVGNAQVFYLSPKSRSFLFLAKLLSETSYNVLYLNSFFNPVFTQIPLLLMYFCLVPLRPVVIAPRGEFSTGALSIRSFKKLTFIWLTSLFGLYRSVNWHATAGHELIDLQAVLPYVKPKNITVAPVLSQQLNLLVEYSSLEIFRIVFVSRISPMKNLKFALKVLAKVNIPVQFSIYGPIEDVSYWDGCNELISKLPKHISVKYGGVLDHSQVLDVISQNELFFLPTFGENYGHVIMESLLAGTPVLIADTTPWRNLQDLGVGWDVSLDNEDDFVVIIQEVAQLSRDDYLSLRSNARKYATENAVDPISVSANRSLFLSAALSLGNVN